MTLPRSLFSYLSLFKLRVVGLLVFVSGMTAIIASGGIPCRERLFLFLLAFSLAAAGSAAINNFLDRDIDGIMERTKGRPLPAGRVSPRIALGLGIGLLLLSLPLALRLNLLVMLFILAGALIYIGVYTLWLKRRSPWNIVIGGMAEGFGVLAGWAAIAPLSWLPFFLSFLVFLWTPLHFWNFALVRVEDYRRAGIPMLPVKTGPAKAAEFIGLSAASLFGISLIPYLVGYFDVTYLIAVLASGVLLWGNIRLFSHPDPSLAWRNYKLSGPYLALLFLGMTVDTLV